MYQQNLLKYYFINFSKLSSCFCNQIIYNFVLSPHITTYYFHCLKITLWLICSNHQNEIKWKWLRTKETFISKRFNCNCSSLYIYTLRQLRKNCLESCPTLEEEHVRFVGIIFGNTESIILKILILIVPKTILS